MSCISATLMQNVIGATPATMCWGCGKSCSKVGRMIMFWQPAFPKPFANLLSSHSKRSMSNCDGRALALMKWLLHKDRKTIVRVDPDIFDQPKLIVCKEMRLRRFAILAGRRQQAWRIWLLRWFSMIWLNCVQPHKDVMSGANR